jgi:hypothetical protein
MEKLEKFLTTLSIMQIVGPTMTEHLASFLGRQPTEDELVNAIFIWWCIRDRERRG